jgi:hypothetical protein
MRRLFERGITVRDIAEPCISFDDERSAQEIQDFLETKEYDVFGVRTNGIIEAYAVRSTLGEGRLRDFAMPIPLDMQLSESSPLLAVFDLLRIHRWVFVTISSRVWGLVTRGDLHKVPVRMWIFCLISLTEMHTLRIVRKCYPNEEWIDLKYVSDARLAEARKLLDKRKAVNEEIDLTDCLQLCDEATILRKTDKMVHDLGFESKAKMESFFAKVERLRNPLAHAQDIITNQWPKLADLAIELEKFLKVCETLEVGGGPLVANGD